MILSFHPVIDADVQIVLGDRTLNRSDYDWINKARAIILPQACPEMLYRACSNSSAHLFPRYDLRFLYSGKMGQSRLFEDFGFSHPRTCRWNNEKEFREAYPELDTLPHEFPFFIKENPYHEGEGLHFVQSKPSLTKVLNRLREKEAQGPWGFVTQDYVPCGGNVLRVVILGKGLVSYWKRPKKKGEVITTISRGALIDHHWRPHFQEKAKFHAEVFSKKTGINLAAIDFVFHEIEKDPGPIFLEINYYFGRRGLGGTENYYALLYKALQDWLVKEGLDPNSVRLV